MSTVDFINSRRAFLGNLAALLPAGWLMGADDTATFSTGVNVVNVLATVRDKDKKIITDLQKDDFRLEEDAHPQTIRYFARESGLPLTLGLLVDTSMSQRRVLGEERTASLRFLTQVLREDKDMAFVIHFDREVELLQDLTSSRTQLEAALGQLEMPQMNRRGQGGSPGGGGPGGGGGMGRRRGPGGTSLYDAVLLASDELMKKQSGRKALIMLSDGVDNGSKTSPSSCIESAQRADTLVYSILFADPQQGRPGGGFGGGPGGAGRRGGGGGRRRPMPVQHTDGKKVLERLATETGGGFFEVSKKHPIEKIYAQLEEELRNQYSLGYTSDRTDAGPGFRKIALTTTRKGLTVQTRPGYYAER